MPLPTMTAQHQPTLGPAIQDEPGLRTLLPDAPNVRRLAINFLLLTGGECFAKLLTFVSFVYLGRVLGPEGYGSLEFVLATMVFFTLPVDFGLGTYGAREVARNPGRAAELLREITLLRLVLASLSFSALLVLIAVVPENAEVKLLMALYGLSLFAVPALIQWFFQGHDRMHWVALASITRQGVFTGLLLCLFRADTPLPYIGAFECASVVAMAIVSRLVLRQHLQPVHPSGQAAWTVLQGHLRKSAPIGLGELAWAFYWYFVTVLLGLLVGGEALGWFGASHRVVMALHTFVWLYFFNLLPSLTRCSALPGEQLRNLLHRSLGITAWAGILIALAVTLLAEKLLTLAYGAGFTGAARVFAALVWMIPIALLSGHYRFTLIAYGFQKLEFYCTLGAALTSITLGLILIPWYGALGAACALLAANVLNFGLAYACLRWQVADIPFHGQLALPLLAGILALALYGALDRAYPWLALSAATVAYTVPLIVWARHNLGSWQIARPGLALPEQS